MNGPLLLARSARRAGQIRRAESLYWQALRLHPRDAETAHELAILLVGQGELAKACRLFARAVSLRPHVPHFLFHHAECLRALGRLEEAVRAYRAAADRGLAGDPLLALGLGRSLLGLGRYDEAADALRVRPGSDSPELALERMAALALCGEEAAAEQEWQRLLSASAIDDRERADQCVRIADAFRFREDWEPAVRWYRRALERDPGRATAWTMLGGCLERLGCMEASRRSFEEATRLAPELADAWLGLGVARETFGEFEAACEAFERSIELRPQLARAYYHLAMMHRAAHHRERIEKLLEGTALDQEARIDAHFALARIHEDAGRHDAAFAHYARANRRKRRRHPFDMQGHRCFMERLETLVRQDPPWAHGGRSWEGAVRPLLVVGMPRSGTTLLESMLARHGAVRAGGEREDLRRLAAALPRWSPAGRDYPGGLRELPPRACEEMRRIWRDSVEAAGEGSRYLVDKLPGNAVRLPLAAVLAGDVPILWCRRDPRDLCLSCFTTHFASGMRFSTDLADCARVWRLQERWMNLCRELLPNPILEVRYEDLVAQPEVELRRIFAFLGLAYEPACLAFHERTGSVHTASFHQVRTPLYRSSIGRWRRFADHLGPLLRELRQDPE